MVVARIYASNMHAIISSMHWSFLFLRRPLAMLVLAPLLLSSDCPGGYKRGFCVISRKPEVVGGRCLGVFCYVPRDLSNGTWIIAIGHHSRKLGRKLCLSVFPSVALIFRTLQKATGQSFCPIKLQICTSKVQGPTVYPFWRLGGWDPPTGIFCPLKTPQVRKKLQLTTWNCVEHILHGQTKFVMKKILDQGHPQVEL